MATLRDIKTKNRQYRQHADHHEDHEDGFRVEAPAGAGGAGKDQGLRAQDGRAVTGRVVLNMPEDAHPLLATREEIKKVLIVSIASDRGLCRRLQHQCHSRSGEFRPKEPPELRTDSRLRLGRKIRDYLGRRKDDIVKDWVDVKNGRPGPGHCRCGRANRSLSHRGI